MNLLSDKVWISQVQVYPQWSQCIPPMKPPSPSTGSNSDAVSYEFPGTSMGGLHSKRCGRWLLGEYHYHSVNMEPCTVIHELFVDSCDKQSTQHHLPWTATFCCSAPPMTTHTVVQHSTSLCSSVHRVPHPPSPLCSKHIPSSVVQHTYTRQRLLQRLANPLVGFKWSL